jgi:hypothetical protein
MKFSVKTTITEVELEAWAERGRWYASIPEARVLVFANSLDEVLAAASVALEAQVEELFTLTMRAVRRQLPH